MLFELVMNSREDSSSFLLSAVVAGGEGQTMVSGVHGLEDASYLPTSHLGAVLTVIEYKAEPLVSRKGSYVTIDLKH
jgi:hypothetical protein